MIFGREPARWIGLIVTLILGAVATLLGEGFISDAASGRITDFVDAIAQLALLFAPYITSELIRTQVTPAKGA